jgi:hypothetical protein
MRILLAAVVVILGVGHVVAEPGKIEWSDLVDDTAQSFDDPFRELSYDQLTTLRRYADTQKRLASATVTETERPGLESRLADAEASLEADGIDPNWLISQRWIVAERRQKAMTAANQALDGSEVVIAGYAIPALSQDDGTRVAYLVPERGMCSHTPAPPPNQMIRLLLSDSWSPSMMHEPVVVSGRLSIDPTSHQMLVVDGFMTLDAAFSMDVSSAKTFRNTKATTPVVNEWAAGIADRFLQAEKPETGND